MSVVVLLGCPGGGSVVLGTAASFPSADQDRSFFAAENDFRVVVLDLGLKNEIVLISLWATHPFPSFCDRQHAIIRSRGRIAGLMGLVSYALHIRMHLCAM